MLLQCGLETTAILNESSMNQPKQIYKSETRISKIPSCSLEKEYLKKLFDVLVTANDEAKSYALKEIKRENFPTDGKFEDFKKLVESSYKMTVSVSGANGEFFTSYDSTIFDDIHLPDKVKSVYFSNVIFFMSQFNIEPAFKIEVNLDFSTPKIFDFSIKPSDETPNTSAISISGLNQTWVTGNYEKVISSLKERSKASSWLHQKNVYDLLVWFGVIPLTFYYLHKFDPALRATFSNLISVLFVGLYLYLFLIVLMLFMTFFKYARWLYPYLELKDNLNNRAVRHRIFFFSIFVSVIGSIVLDLISYIRTVM